MYYRTGRAMLCLEVFYNFNRNCQRHISKSFQTRRLLHNTKILSLELLYQLKRCNSAINVRRNNCELSVQSSISSFKTMDSFFYSNKRLNASHVHTHKLQSCDKYCGRCSCPGFPFHNEVTVSKITNSLLYNYITSTRNHATKSLSSFTLKKKRYRDYIQSLEGEYKSLLDLKETNSPRFGQKERMELQKLQPVVEVSQQVKQKYEDLQELESLARDEEMKGMVEEEMTEVLSSIKELEEELASVLVPQTKVDNCDIVLEVECGAGGLESMLFAKEIFNMYANFCTGHGWQFETIEITEGERGYHSASASISGRDVYQQMKFEGGVHRVQRVPATESKGRIHTSTVTVAILPQPNEIDIEINKKDLKIEAMRASGPGGQNVNCVSTAVRMVHLPTGITTRCEETRSQYKNQELALKKLKSRLYEIQMSEQTSSTSSQRKIQIGNKDRSEKIRTYNYPQDRITDHRIGFSISNLQNYMLRGSGLPHIMEKLQEGAKYEEMESKLEEFERRCQKIRNEL